MGEYKKGCNTDSSLLFFFLLLALIFCGDDFGGFGCRK